MNKTAIKNFAVWARNKLISEITYKASLVGISEKGISTPLPTSIDNIQFFDIGTGKPTEIANEEVKQRTALVSRIKDKEKTSDYKTAFQFVMEEVAYTWFNRLVAIRFMEVNEYLPSKIRVLSSEMQGKAEPDMVTTPFDTDMEFSPYETDRIMQLKDENKLDELFRMLFIKQCNKLNEVLPELFEKTNDYTEYLLNISFTDKDGIVAHLVTDIEEKDFTEAVEIIGWLYQYYNTEPKEKVIDVFKGTPIKKHDIPAATQIFTTDWVVRYMVDNSLGRYWIERNPNSTLAEKLDFFVTPKNGEINYIDEKVTPIELSFFDPCMGSGHILVYAFDVLMEIYREMGYTDRDAAQSIIENNIYGLDIDDRAYQLAYFAVMMKARSYDRRFLTRDIAPHVTAVQESNGLSKINSADGQVKIDDIVKMNANHLLDVFENAKELGSLVTVKDIDFESIKQFMNEFEKTGADNLFDFNWYQSVFSKMKYFIKQGEILSKKYDVVCTNPPYLNKYSDSLKKYVVENFKDYSGDLFSVFMYKNFQFCKVNGYSAFMTPNVWMFIKTYEKLREYIINNKSISSLIQIAKGAFYKEATVDVMGFVLKNSNNTEKGLYIRLDDFKGDMEVQKQKVLEAIVNKECGYFYETHSDSFKKITGSPISFWATENQANAFLKSTALADIANPRQGLITGDVNRFVRKWYECSLQNTNFAHEITEGETSEKWFPYNNGGGYRKWYGNNEDVVNWYDDGTEVKNFTDEKGKQRSRPQNQQFYFLEGGTWSAISSGSFSIRYFSAGYLFSNAGMAVYASHEKLLYIIGFLNSKLTKLYLGLFNEGLNYNQGDIAKLPILYNKNSSAEICMKVNNIISFSKQDWDSFETSWDFVKHPLVQGVFKLSLENSLAEKYIEASYMNWEKKCNERFNTLKANEEELNRIFIDIYGLQDELTPEVNDKDVTVRKADLSRDIKSLVSYAVGCMFGRYSLDVDGLAYAGGDWDDSKYKTFIPDTDNVIPITDEEYFADDIVGLFVAFVKKVYGEDTLEENLDFISKALGNKGKTAREVIRNYFVKDFYKDHVKTYQKRPIYWLYDSGKADGFKALIYMHRYTADTTGLVRVDYLHKMQRTYMSEIDRMQDEIENGKTSADISKAEKRKEKLIKQLKETKEYDEKIAHLALSRIAIDLDDGVKVNYDKVQTAQDGKMLNVLGKI